MSEPKRRPLTGRSPVRARRTVPTFTVEVALEGRAPASGSGRSKREAEQAAAAAMLATAGVPQGDRRG